MLESSRVSLSNFFVYQGVLYALGGDGFLYYFTSNMWLVAAIPINIIVPPPTNSEKTVTLEINKEEFRKFYRDSGFLLPEDELYKALIEKFGK